MIVVDTSALMAILRDEESAHACSAALEANDRLLMSAATVAEALIVADRRGLGTQMRTLIDGLGLEIVDVTPAVARDVADVYERWGKGVHPAALNFGDCFAYALASDRRCPLLYVGDDFVQTDIVSALAAQ